MRKYFLAALSAAACFIVGCGGGGGGGGSDNTPPPPPPATDFSRIVGTWKGTWSETADQTVDHGNFTLVVTKNATDDISIAGVVTSTHYASTGAFSQANPGWRKTAASGNFADGIAANILGNWQTETQPYFRWNGVIFLNTSGHLVSTPNTLTDTLQGTPTPISVLVDLVKQ